MSKAAEKTILGLMLTEKLAVADSLSRLRWDDFSLSSHQDIYKAMGAMSDRGEHIDIVTICAELGPAAVESCGGRAYLFELTDRLMRGMHTDSYIRLIENASLARRGREVCRKAQERLADEVEDAAEVLDWLGSELTNQRPSVSLTAAEVMPDALAMMQGKVETFRTGVTELDLLTRGGLRPKELWVIGALPSAGKSALLRQIERGVMAHGVHTHSIEVPKEDWVRMHVAAEARVESWKIRDPEQLTEMDKIAMEQAGKAVSQWNHVIDDMGSVDLRSLLSRSRLSTIRRGIRVHTVDYLQLMHGDGKTRHEQIGQICRDLKLFAKAHNCAVILLSQLNEGRGDGKGDNRPTLKDLRESGDIRQAADVIILNYRPKEDDQYTGMDELILAKQRNGAIGPIPMRYENKTLTFESRP